MWLKITIALWLLSTTITSQTISCGETIDGITTSDAGETYQFKLSTNFTSVTFSTCYDETGWDTELVLKDPDGSEITSNDDIGDDCTYYNGWLSEITVTLADISYGATYDLAVRTGPYSWDQYGAFKLTATCDNTYTGTPTPTGSPVIITTQFQTTFSVIDVYCNDSLTGSISEYNTIQYLFSLPSQYGSVTFTSCLPENQADTRFELLDGSNRACANPDKCLDDDANCPDDSYAAVLEIPPGQIDTDTEYVLNLYSYDSGNFAFEVRCFEPPSTYIRNISCDSSNNQVNQNITQPPSDYYYYQFYLPNEIQKVFFTTCFPETTDYWNYGIKIHDSNFTELFTSFGSAIPCEYSDTGYALVLTLEQDMHILPNTAYYISVNYKYDNSDSDLYTLGVTCTGETSNIPKPTNPTTSDLECGAVTPKTSSDSGQQIFYYEFSFPTGYTSAIFTTCNFEGPDDLDHDTRIIVYNSNFDKISENDDSACAYFNYAATSTLNGASGNTYYLSVSYSAYPDVNIAFDFILSVRCYGDGYDDIEPVAMETLSCGDTKTGEITNSKSVYYYEFKLDMDYDKLIVSTCNAQTELKSTIAIYDEFFNLLEENVDADNSCEYNTDASYIIWVNNFVNGSLFYISVTPEAQAELGAFALDTICLVDEPKTSNKLDITGITPVNLECGTNAKPSQAEDIFYYSFQFPAGFDEVQFSSCLPFTDISDTIINLYDSNLTWIDATATGTQDNGCWRGYYDFSTDNSDLYYLTTSYIAYPDVPVSGIIGLSTACFDSNYVNDDIYPALDYCTRVNDSTSTCYIDKQSNDPISSITCDPMYRHCMITCGPGSDACFGVELECPTGYDDMVCGTCMLDCSGDDACAYMKVYGKDCELLRIEINNDNQNDMTILAPGNGGSLEINGDNTSYADMEYANITSVPGTANMNLNFPIGDAQHNVINGEYVTGYLNYTCGGGDAVTWCRGTEILCPNDANCFIKCLDDCSSSSYPMIVYAQEGTYDVDWYCQNGSHSACDYAELRCYGNDSMYSITTFLDYNYNNDLWQFDNTSGPGCTDLPTEQPTPSPTNQPTKYPSLQPTTATPTNIPTEEYGFCDDSIDGTSIAWEGDLDSATDIAQETCEFCLCKDLEWECLDVINDIIKDTFNWNNIEQKSKQLLLKICKFKNKQGNECKKVGLQDPDSDIKDCLCDALFNCQDDVEVGAANKNSIWKVVLLVVVIILVA